MLLAEHEGIESYTFHKRLLEPCFLGKGSYLQQKSQTAQLQKAEEAIHRLIAAAKDFGATYILAAGTSAMRDYKLGPFLSSFPSLQASIISGDQEALLVKHAMQRSLPATLEGNKVFMDIGGGSVELSYVSQQQEISHSFNTGVRRLQEVLNLPTQLTAKHITRIEDFLFKQKPEWNTLPKAEHLIDCSGTMETLFALLNSSKSVNDYLLQSPASNALACIDSWLFSTLDERLNETRIPHFRAELLVIGFSIIRYYLKSFGTSNLYYSKFGLKEGLFFEDLNTRYAQSTDN